MRKSDKKIDNNIRCALTEVCDVALKEFAGFQWLTHLVNYSNFPKSLKIVCVFDTKDSLRAFIGHSGDEALIMLVQKSFTVGGIKAHNLAGHISYDTEESCNKDHNGKWAERFAQ